MAGAELQPTVWAKKLQHLSISQQITFIFYFIPRNSNYSSNSLPWHKNALPELLLFSNPMPTGTIRLLSAISGEEVVGNSCLGVYFEFWREMLKSLLL